MYTWNGLMGRTAAQRICGLLVLLLGFVGVAGSGTAAAGAAAPAKWIGARWVHSSAMTTNPEAGLGLHDGRYAMVEQRGTSRGSAFVSYRYGSNQPQGFVCIFYRTPPAVPQQPPTQLAIVATIGTDPYGLSVERGQLLPPLIMGVQSRVCADFGAVRIAAVEIIVYAGRSVEIDAIEGQVGPPVIYVPQTGQTER